MGDHLHLNGRQVAQYVLLPGIVPRIQGLFFLNFAFLASAFAACFSLVRLLPRTHPFLRPEAHGTFSLLAVLRAAAAELTFEWRRADQIIMFFALVTGFVLFVLFFALAALNLVIAPAQAAGILGGLGGGWNISGWLYTPNPSHDIALMLLDRVLGVTDGSGGAFFGSGVPSMCPGMQPDLPCSNPPAFPSPFQNALHQMLHFYTVSLMTVGVLIFLYFIVVLVYDTTLTGKPMGTRFNRFWAPIRIVFALGLLIPLSPHGLNSAQYIVLAVARSSSALATNFWIEFNSLAGKNPLGAAPSAGPDGAPSTSMVSYVEAPEMTELVRFLHVVQACSYYYNRLNPDVEVEPYFVRAGAAAVPVRSDGAALPFADAEAFFNHQNIVIAFGVPDPVPNSPLLGGIDPLCGQIVIPYTSQSNPGAAEIQEAYYGLVTDVFLDPNAMWYQYMRAFGSMMVERGAAELPAEPGKTALDKPCRWDSNGNNFVEFEGDGADLKELGNCHEEPKQDYMFWMIEQVQNVHNSYVDQARRDLDVPGNWTMDAAILDRGWAGAGIWYNQVAALNGSFISAAYQLPFAAKNPEVIEAVMAKRGMTTPMPRADDIFGLGFKDDQSLGLSGEDKGLIQALHLVHRYWYSDAGAYSFVPKAGGGASPFSGLSGTNAPVATPKGHVVIDAINTILGTKVLFDFRRNSHVHPLAQLTGFGRALLEKSVRHLMTGSTIAMFGGVISVGNQDVGKNISMVAKFFVTVASIFFMAGVVLYYLIPFLPFVYFFFAVLSWVKAIFEALIGAPLWALAHLRLAGQGLPSGPSISGYLLFMEIALRPVVTVFALLGAIALFSGSVYVMNDVFDLAVSSSMIPTSDELGSGNYPAEMMRDPLDKFFFNILFVILCYIFANSSFKLIDAVPNRFMRWFGRASKSLSAEAFARDNPAGDFDRNVMMIGIYPVQGMLNKADNIAYSAANMLGNLANEASKTESQPEGALRAGIQNLFGKDRATRFSEFVGGISSQETKLYGETAKLGKQVQAFEKKEKLTDQEKEALQQAKQQLSEKQQTAKYLTLENMLKVSKGEMPAGLTPDSEAYQTLKDIVGGDPAAFQARLSDAMKIKRLDTAYGAISDESLMREIEQLIESQTLASINKKK